MRGTLWWDFDGTLASRPRMWAEAALRLATSRYPGHDVSVSHLARQFKSQFPWHEVAHPELSSPQLWWDAVYAAYRNTFARLGLGDLPCGLPDLREDILDARGYRLFDDTLLALQHAAASGWRQVVVSNHVPELAAIVRDLGLDHFFHAVVTSGLVGYEKPHPRMFEVAVHHSVAGAPLWMIGDNLACDCVPVSTFGAGSVLVRQPSLPDHRCAPDLHAALAIIDAAEPG